MYIVKLIYFMLPAAFANGMGTLSKGVDFLNVPVDFGKTLGGKRIFGKNKTWRGVFFGTVVGIIVAVIQSFLYNFDFFRSISMIDYSNPVIIGFLMGFGDHFGDLTESFFKRRLGIPPGDPFIPFDQMDGPIGALLLSYPLTKISLKDATYIILIWFAFHVIIKHISFRLGIDKKKW